MDKAEFMELYYTKPLKDLVKILDCSVPTIYSRLDEYGIPKKGQGKGKRRKRKFVIEEWDGYI